MSHRVFQLKIQGKFEISKNLISFHLHILFAGLYIIINKVFMKDK